jgi:hypothetical protein
VGSAVRPPKSGGAQRPLISNTKTAKTTKTTKRLRQAARSEGSKTLVVFVVLAVLVSKNSACGAFRRRGPESPWHLD